MDQNDTVTLVEEEKFGWTILSTIHGGGELHRSKETLLTPQVDVGVLGARSDGPNMILIPEEEKTDGTDEDTDEKEARSDGPNMISVPEQLKTNGTDEKENEGRDGYDEEDNDADEEHEDHASRDGTEVFLTSSFMWEPEPNNEASPRFIAKQTLSQQPGRKQILLWRASLAVTLGFLGLVVMNGLSCGGKNLGCLKLHPCSVKGGKPILTSL